MKVSCLLPTYNRMGTVCAYLLQEAVQSFLLQTYGNKELIICNDTPGQIIKIDHPEIKVINLEERFSSLSDKIQYMIDNAAGQAICRWDDDDICLPTRLAYSVEKLTTKMEWRCANHLYMERGIIIKETPYAGNCHIQSIFRKELIGLIGGYPKGLSGNEDQAFNNLIDRYCTPNLERISMEDIFYIYRWGTGSHHLSGVASKDLTNPHQDHYNALGTLPIIKGVFNLVPTWTQDYVALARNFISQLHPVDYRAKHPRRIGG